MSPSMPRQSASANLRGAIVERLELGLTLAAREGAALLRDQFRSGGARISCRRDERDDPFVVDTKYRA